jgi:nickel-dependent lactate racemase
LRYGADRSVDIEFADGVLLAACDLPQGSPLTDTTAAVNAALDSPLGFPPLARGTTPGDRVVLAVERDVPEAPRIISATVDYLVRSGVAPDGIAVLTAVNDPQTENLRDAWTADWKSHVTVAMHDPLDQRRLAYLARSAAGTSVFLNRLLTEADLVVPIGTIRRRTAAGYFGVHSPVFPTFANQPAVLRFRTPQALRRRGRHTAHLCQEVAEVAWLLGVTFTVQVVPAGGQRALAILAGDPATVESRGRALYDAAWHGAVPDRAALVVAAIEGEASEQSWLNVGRAVAAASPLVEEGGAVALCSTLAAEPGPAVQLLSEVADPEDALRQIRKAKPDDILPATQLIRTLRRARVYLLSELDAGQVEQLNMVPLSSASELSRLAHRYRSCIVLSNAPHASVRVRTESNETT